VISSGTPLGEVFSTDRVEVRLPLDDAQLAALGLPIGFSADGGDAPPAQFSADVAGERQEWIGYLRHIDAAIDPSTRLIYATAELDDPYDSGRSAGGMPMAVGLFVEAELRGRKLTDAVRIPSKGLRPGDQIYVVDAGGLLDIREVTVDFANGDYAVISEGLRAGERVVVSALRDPISGMSLATIDERRYASREN
jgi:multidrug efflux pump subunit AcrA (membrane-fusion protein)